LQTFKRIYCVTSHFVCQHKTTDKVRDPAAGEENEVIQNPEGSKDPDLEPAMKEQVRDYFENKDDSFAAVLVAYEMEDASVFPKTAFRPSMVNLSPEKYWKYLEKISTGSRNCLKCTGISDQKETVNMIAVRTII